MFHLSITNYKQDALQQMRNRRTQYSDLYMEETEDTKESTEERERERGGYQ